MIMKKMRLVFAENLDVYEDDNTLILTYTIDFSEKMEEVLIRCPIRYLRNYEFAKKLATERLFIDVKKAEPSEIAEVLGYFSEIDELVISIKPLYYEEVLAIAANYKKYTIHCV
jgi:hypothetical protein